jgi:hypothetical protein
VLRHELLALHFANGGIPYGAPGPQVIIHYTSPIARKLTLYNTNNLKFYIMCAAVDIEGTGIAEPAGVTFPGAYKKDDPGLNFKLYPKHIETSEKKIYVSFPLSLHSLLNIGGLFCYIKEMLMLSFKF